MNDKERINYLLDQYLSGRLSKEEVAELLSIIEDSEESMLEAFGGVLSVDIARRPYTGASEPNPKRKKEILKKILSSDKTLQVLSPQGGGRRSLWCYGRRVAASIALLGMTTAVYLWQQAKSPSSETTQLVAPLRSGQSLSHTRSFTLPDSSLVVLKAGSTLYWPTTFTGGTREVTLKGEAYFDIRHLEKHGYPGGAQPFIIHTGKVKTTVLGTAFHIKANPEEKDIVVSVTKGRVRVEDESRVLAILTQDQRVTYTVEDADSKADQTAEHKEMDWVRTDMEFAGVSFESITRILEKRYGVQISFSNPELRDCMIVATFSGTESLRNVLETLCTVRDVTYRAESANRFTIVGNGCD